MFMSNTTATTTTTKKRDNLQNELKFSDLRITMCKRCGEVGQK